MYPYLGNTFNLKINVIMIPRGERVLEMMINLSVNFKQSLGLELDYVSTIVFKSTYDYYLHVLFPWC